MVNGYHKEESDDDEVDDVISESLELIYGSTADEKLEGTNKILAHCRDVRFLEKIIEHHQLMSAFARLFGEAENQPVELNFALGKLFLALSFIDDFHSVLSDHRIGAMAFAVVELEVKRARHRGLEAGTDAAMIQSPHDCSLEQPSSQSYCAFKKKQERVLFVCLGILNNIADDLGVLRKMMKKSLVTWLTECIHQKSAESVLVTICLIKKASIFEETVVGLSTQNCKMVSKLAQLLTTEYRNDIKKEALATLFNLSFYQGCIELISNESIHSALVVMLQEPLLVTQALQLMYHLSSTEENRQKLFEARLSPELIDLLPRISSSRTYDRGIAGLFVNVS